jgi:hypothetical protein
LHHRSGQFSLKLRELPFRLDNEDHSRYAPHQERVNRISLLLFDLEKDVVAVRRESRPDVGRDVRRGRPEALAGERLSLSNRHKARNVCSKCFDWRGDAEFVGRRALWRRKRLLTASSVSKFFSDVWGASDVRVHHRSQRQAYRRRALLLKTTITTPVRNRPWFRRPRGKQFAP